MPTGFHPNPHFFSAHLELAVELLRFLAVPQFPLVPFTRVRIDKRNLLEARVIVTTYNDHVRLLSPEPWLASATKVYSGVGADIVMESLHSRPGSERNRLLTTVDVRFTLAVQRPVICSSLSGYRAPSIFIFEEALSMSRRSSGVSSTEAAPRFSSGQAAKRELSEQVLLSFVLRPCSEDQPTPDWLFEPPG